MRIFNTIFLAVRSLRRAPGLTIVAILTLAIGLSASVALFGVFDSGARDLPVPGGRNIVELEVHDARGKRVDGPAPVDTWALGSGVEAAGALVQTMGTLSGIDKPAVRATGAAMQPSVFRLLGIAPALGRVPSEETTDENAILLGWDLFTAFGSSSSILGSVIRVDGVPHTVIGVMPKSFGFPENQSYWTVLPPSVPGEVVARLKDGASLDAIAAGVSARVAAVTRGDRVVVQRWTHSRDSGGEGAVFAGLGVLVVLLLAVCAANVATLLLVRANERASTLAVHAALGASRFAVAMQLLVEALLIACAGGTVGLTIGYGMLHWMQQHLAQHWGYYWMRMEVRTPVIAATFAAVLFAAVVAGVASAWRASRLNLSSLLGSAGRGASSPRQRHLGRWFVATQVAFSTIGLVAAAFLAWGATRVGLITSLLPMDQIAFANITFPNDIDASRRSDLVAQMRTELLRIPRASVVSIAPAAPGGGGSSARLQLPGQDTTISRETVGYAGADAALFRAYSMKIVMGRSITAEDERSSKRVAVVTPLFVRRHLQGAPIGQQIHLAGVHGNNEWAEIIGVVQDWFPEQNNNATDRVFVPMKDVNANELYIAVRSTSHTNEAVVLPAIRAAVAKVDNDVPVSDLQTLRERMNWFLRMTRVIAAFGIVGGVGSALVAAIGLYGVIAFQVRSTLREIGVRIALGSGASRIMRDVLRESVLRVLPGLLAGMAVGILAVPALGRFTGAGANPPSILLLTGVACGMLLIGAIAALQPALRAARLSPLTALRDG